MFGGKNTIRQAMAAVDEEMKKTVAEVGQALDEFKDDIPLRGLSVQRMHDIEEKGLKLCEARFNDIKAEIERLTAEARSTETIMVSIKAKLAALRTFLGQPSSARPEVPPAIHSDIRAGSGPLPAEDEKAS